MQDSQTLLQIIFDCQALRDRSLYTPYERDEMETAIVALAHLRIRALNDEKNRTLRRRQANEQAMGAARR